MGSRARKVSTQGSAKVSARTLAARVEKRAQLRSCEQLRKELTAQLRLERIAGPPDRGALEDAIRLADGEALRLEGLIDEERVQAGRRKQEIDEWHTWFERLPDADRSSGHLRLDAEIEWRAAEIAQHEQEIQRLFPLHVAARGEVERAKFQLAALEAGAHLLPLGRDPRLVSIRAAGEKLRRALAESSAQREPASSRAARKAPTALKAPRAARALEATKTVKGSGSRSKR